MIHNVPQARKNLIIALAILLSLDIAVIVFIFSPSVRSGAGGQQRYRTLHAELVQKRVETVPTLDMDQKLADARQQIAEFYDQDLPNRYSDISQTLAKAADQSHVQLVNVRYETKTATPQVTEVNLSLQVSGDYESEVRFINALERSRTFLVIQGVNLAEPQGGTIRLALKVQTFLRTAES